MKNINSLHLTSWAKKFFAVSALLLTMVVFFFVAARIRPTLPVSASPSPITKIILDPGHGGMDGGAIGSAGTIEKDINLSISLKLRDMLLLQGYTVLMTRDADISIEDEGVTGAAKIKKSDMYNRLKLIEENPDAIVLSIHQNQFPSSSCHGAQMFYGTKNPMSKELAQSIQSSLVTNLQPANKREIKPGGKDLFLLYKAESPIILVECGFISNPDECDLLLTDEYQSQVAFSVMAGLLQYLQQPPSPLS